jgi:hypothetical protein
MRFSLFAAAVVATAASTFAQTPIGPFTGDQQENFDTGAQVIFTPCMPAGVFNGTAQMCTPNASGCHTTSGWGFMCTIFARSSPRLFGSAGGWVEFTFTQPAFKFGGYFGTNCGTPDATIEFYDVGNNLIGSVVANSDGLVATKVIACRGR